LKFANGLGCLLHFSALANFLGGLLPLYALTSQLTSILDLQVFYSLKLSLLNTYQCQDSEHENQPVQSAEDWLKQQAKKSALHSKDVSDIFGSSLADLWTFKAPVELTM